MKPTATQKLFSLIGIKEKFATGSASNSKAKKIDSFYNSTFFIHPFKYSISVLLLFFFFENAISQTCPPPQYSWATWNNFTGTSATGTIMLSGQPINITMTSNFDFGSTPGIFAYSVFNSFYQTIPNTTVPETTWSGGPGGTTTMCFSQQVTNPVLLLASLGNPGVTLPLSFSKPYVVLFDGGGMDYTSDTSLSGTEGYAIIMFPGNFTCVTINSSGYEYYTNITWGVNPPSFPIGINGNLTGCSAVTLIASGGTFYHWNGGSSPNTATNTFTASGTYKVIVTNSNNCIDSAYAIVTVQQGPPVITNITTVICAGNIYTLPSGKTKDTAGFYRDTVYNISGCDSIITNVTLIVDSPKTVNISATICQGQKYTLPSGITIDGPGFYQDTLKYKSGCDSIITNVTLTVDSVKIVNTSLTICEGQTYKLHSGITIDSSGYYPDTLKYKSGCDSIITNVSLTVDSVKTANTSVTICEGQKYKLPSGITIDSSGYYRDTLRYKSGCDSIITNITLIVDSFKVVNKSVTICEGQKYILPSGITIDSSGYYQDTLKHKSGCDSLITNVTLKVDSAKIVNTSVTICEGQIYTLPSGITIDSSGYFRDTLKHKSGCDSLITNVTLTVDSSKTIDTTVTICQGQTYTLPSGRVVSMPGFYNDIAKHFLSGCDSLITNLTLFVQNVQTKDTSVAICEGQTYTLPWGGVAYTTNVYGDTLRFMATGCDSFITTVNLTVYPLPVVTFSPDTVYIIGNNGIILKPVITGTIEQYLWQPPNGLSPSNTVENPSAAPANSTLYQLKVTDDKGCMAFGTVDVINGLPLLMPSAFTPNGDGINDVYRIPPGVDLNLQEFDIYNRWGALIFSTKNISQGWDGTYSGLPQPQGTYVYVVRGTKLTGSPVLLKGTLVLIR